MSVSTTNKSTPDSISFSALFKPLNPTPVAAATLNRPSLSLQNLETSGIFQYLLQ